MIDARHRLGLTGERLAARWLARRGWTILAMRYRCGHRDLDIVAAQPASPRGRLVAFVEVRTRRSVAFGTPVETVGWAKRGQLVRSARVWISANGRSEDSYRFDVIGLIWGRGGGVITLQYVPNAFEAPGFG